MPFLPPNQQRESTEGTVAVVVVVANKPPGWLIVVAEAVKWVVKGKVFPYSLPSVGPGADAGVQAVSPQVT